MRYYHATSAAQAILADGFRDWSGSYGGLRDVEGTPLILKTRRDPNTRVARTHAHAHARTRARWFTPGSRRGSSTGRTGSSCGEREANPLQHRGVLGVAWPVFPGFLCLTCADLPRACVCAYVCIGVWSVPSVLWFYPVFWVVHLVAELPPGKDHIHQIVFIVLSAAGLLLPARDMIGAGRPPAPRTRSRVSRAHTRKEVLFAEVQLRCAATGPGYASPGCAWASRGAVRHRGRRTAPSSSFVGGVGEYCDPSLLEDDKPINEEAATVCNSQFCRTPEMSPTPLPFNPVPLSTP
jgi:hypothetical protein